MPRRSGVKIRATKYDGFKGADFQNEPGSVDKHRSPLCTNMVSDAGGMPEKRIGWRVLQTITETEGEEEVGQEIHGLFVHKYIGDSGTLLTRFYAHAGTKLWKWEESGTPTVKLTGLPDTDGAKSRAYNMSGCLWITTGNGLIRIKGETAEFITEMQDAYAPLTVITRNPSGGGVTYENINMASPCRRNAFQTNGSATDFYVDSELLDYAVILTVGVAAGTTLFWIDGNGTVLYKIYKFTLQTALTAGEIIRISLEDMKAYTDSDPNGLEIEETASTTGMTNINDVSKDRDREKIKIWVWGKKLPDIQIKDVVSAVANRLMYYGHNGIYSSFICGKTLEGSERIELHCDDGIAIIGDDSYELTETAEEPQDGYDLSQHGNIDIQYKVIRKTGRIIMTTAPAAPGTGNADGLEIRFAKTVKRYAGIINGCTIITGFGVNNDDRIVISGNPSSPNTDYISALNDPTYWPDLNYYTVGAESAAIMGYARIGSYQAIMKEDNGQDSSVYFRTAELDDEGNAVFRLQQAVTGVGAISRGSFAGLLDETLFLSGTGIMAITTNYLTGDKLGQNRSYYLNSKLTKEELRSAQAISWNGYYLLGFPNGHVYVLDGRQAKTYRSQAASDYCYEGYYWEGVPAICWMNNEANGAESVYFGTEDGRICRFNSDMSSMERFSDNGAAIEAVWATKFDDDGDPTLEKTMLKRGCAVSLKPFYRSSASIGFRTSFDPVDYTASGTVDIFSWDDIDFERFSFDSNDAAREIFFNTKVKKYKRLQIVIRNNTVNEGFGVLAISKHYVTGNFAKR